MKARPVIVGAVTAALLTLVVRRLFTVIVVDGVSMEPTYHANERLLAVRAWQRWLVQPGAVVIGRFKPDEPDHLLVKRVRARGPTRLTVALDEFSPALAKTMRVRSAGADVVVWDIAEGQVFVCGDNPGSADSVLWGPVSLAHVDGVVLGRLADTRHWRPVHEETFDPRRRPSPTHHRGGWRHGVRP